MMVLGTNHIYKETTRQDTNSNGRSKVSRASFLDARLLVALLQHLDLLTLLVSVFRFF